VIHAVLLPKGGWNRLTRQDLAGVDSPALRTELKTHKAETLVLTYQKPPRYLQGTVYMRTTAVRSNFPGIVSLVAGLSVPKRILIADDHQVMLRGVRALLQANSGWEICGEAVDGRDAVTKAIELRPDLVVLDYAMPSLDGLSAAKEIHQLLPTVPIVLHTLYGTTEVEQVADKYGIRKVVGKAKRGALISAVEELLRTESTSRPDVVSEETSEIPAPSGWDKG